MKQRSFEEWQRADAAHYMHPFTDSKALAAKGTRVITRGEGIYIYEGKTNRYVAREKEIRAQVTPGSK